MILLCLAFAWAAFLCTGNILLHYGVGGHYSKSLVVAVAVGLALYYTLNNGLDTLAVILFAAIGLELLFTAIIRR